MFSSGRLCDVGGVHRFDPAKSVFQVHGVDAHGKVVVTKRLPRDTALAFFLALCGVGDDRPLPAPPLPHQPDQSRRLVRGPGASSGKLGGVAV
jgi:hypothetical protein